MTISSLSYKEMLRWIGHVLRSNECILQEVLTFIPEGDARGQGRPRRRFYDTIVNLTARGIDIAARDHYKFAVFTFNHHRRSRCLATEHSEHDARMDYFIIFE